MYSFLGRMQHWLPALLIAAVIAPLGTASLSTAVAPAAPAAPVASCAAVDVVVARGTWEPGALGWIVGGPAFSALHHKLPSTSLSSYPVNYPANLNQPKSVQQGNRDLVEHVTNQAHACPHQRFILVGYSQGANVVDNSLGISSDGALVGGPIVATIPASIEPRIAAVLLFGNPIHAHGKSITGTYYTRTKEYCAHRDLICTKGIDPFPHFSYGLLYVKDAAAFAASKL
ncbi:cutinase family protein [Kutzneria sp. CA-103260]|uniref:cutinase family protein n=1 Tax=Kutzneria sp. CA-103260 TaxID=2802641 RepID=UPI001BEDA6BE|nr:cutinase family protein [Kutzneria sp. CA-103260]QUQ67137.1 serine esterase, cutinase [Kutzneria sp. CA-103260]